MILARSILILHVLLPFFCGPLPQMISLVHTVLEDPSLQGCYGRSKPAGMLGHCFAIVDKLRGANVCKLEVEAS